MAIEIRMPKLGMTMEEGKVLAWTKKEKERVDKEEVKEGADKEDDPVLFIKPPLLTDFTEIG